MPLLFNNLYLMNEIFALNCYPFTHPCYLMEHTGDCFLPHPLRSENMPVSFSAWIANERPVHRSSPFPERVHHP